MIVDETKPPETKTGSGVQGLMKLARRSLPELRRNAETIIPLREGGERSFLDRTRRKLAWTRLPGLVPADALPDERPSVKLMRSFVTFVLLPTAVIATYLFVFASDQWVVESEFAVRGAVEPMEDIVLGPTTQLLQKHNSQDSFIVREFIRSRPLVEALEKDIGVVKMFSRPEADFWARFNPERPIEYLMRYWRRQVEARIDTLSGVIHLNVRTFAPEDSMTISREIIARTEIFINELSRRAQADMIAHSQKDFDASSERLKKARVALQEFRNRWGIIDPLATAKATATTIESLKKDKLTAENDLRVLRSSNLEEKSRSIQTLAARVAALDAQINQLQGRLTTAGLNSDAANNLTQALLEYEQLMIEQTVAEKINASTLFLLDRARVMARKQQIFLATFVPPAHPTMSLYPERFNATFIAFFCFLTIWSSASLIAAGVRDSQV
ncbi:capsule biosynthesis protein [Methylobacterium organophilum]|uniref:Capsule biosynthesis protein n=1 Tax=Methylobacterium organophilum TaxID=410 RepID=A0ABQ4T6P4_METOR|nr:capsule biosynthesis protein [Methylobacterium organophilum]UMY17835.1 capsule biosynthesis protein [Methylobacterium organophilum]GJE25926.1 hypothetical protein LKMONMHP_0770 [Methylobacterium organophilum]